MTGRRSIGKVWVKSLEGLYIHMGQNVGVNSTLM